VNVHDSPSFLVALNKFIYSIFFVNGKRAEDLLILTKNGSAGSEREGLGTNCADASIVEKYCSLILAVCHSIARG
jgi:hypothetical protein